MNKKTKKTIEAGIADAIAQVHRGQQGRGPQDVRVDIISDVILVRQTGVLNPMEARLATTPEGRRLVRNARKELDEIARRERNSTISAIVGCNVIRSYGDIDVAAGEEVCVLVLETDIEMLLFRRELAPLSGSSL